MSRLNTWNKWTEYTKFRRYKYTGQFLVEEHELNNSHSNNFGWLIRALSFTGLCDRICRLTSYMYALLEWRRIDISRVLDCSAVKWRNSYTCFLVAAFTPHVEYSNAVLNIILCFVRSCACFTLFNGFVGQRFSESSLFGSSFFSVMFSWPFTKDSSASRRREWGIYLMFDKRTHGKCCRHRLFRNDGAGASVLILILTVDVEVIREKLLIVGRFVPVRHGFGQKVSKRQRWS